MNDHVWQEFVMSPRIPQLICRFNSIDKRVPLQICDAIRCRYNLLAHLNPCVFSIWDEIEAVNPNRINCESDNRREVVGPADNLDEVVRPRTTSRKFRQAA